MSVTAAVLGREEWRLIPGSNDLYSVSNLGRVRSEPIEGKHTGRQRGRILTAQLSRKGYHQLGLSLPDRRVRAKVHSLVAAAFIGERTEGMQVNHKNGIKTDNRPSNLEYVTCLENIRHAYASGLCKVRANGERNSKAKLTTEAVRQIRRVAGGLSLSEISDRFGVTKTNVSYIINRKTWRHVA